MSLLLALLLACTGADDPKPDDTDIANDTDLADDTDVADDTDPDTDGVDSDPLDSDPAETDIADDTDLPPDSCAAASGICTSGDRCPDAFEDATFAGDCVFDDGPGVCCLAPPPQPTGDTCADYGGVCAPIAGCGFVDGDFAPGTCRDAWPGLICCVPETLCGPHTMICCGDGVSYVPMCDRGTLDCPFPDTTLMDEALCILP
jgi:hypothetical protein